MKAKELLQKYYAQLVREGLIKSALYGLVVGFSTLLLTSAVWWFVGWKSLWICAILTVLAFAVSTAIIYRLKFRPTVKNTARRVDALGLEERLITMSEFEDQDSTILKLQREDAKKQLGTVNEKLLKIVVSTALIVTLAVVGVGSIGMTTTAAVSKKSGWEVFSSINDKPPAKFEVEYHVDGMGSIFHDGELKDEVSFKVEKGSDGEAVLAVPALGYVFVKWSDGLTDPYRVERNVLEAKDLDAIFQKVEEIVDLPDDKESGGLENEYSMDPPQEGEPGAGKPDPEAPPQEGDPTDQPPETVYEPINQVIDGNTYYGDTVYDNAYEDMIARLEGDGNLTEEEKQMILQYFATIKK